MLHRGAGRVSAKDGFMKFLVKRLEDVRDALHNRPAKRPAEGYVRFSAIFLGKPEPPGVKIGKAPITVDTEDHFSRTLHACQVQCFQ
jgi:hypothetical protein